MQKWDTDINSIGGVDTSIGDTGRIGSSIIIMWIGVQWETESIGGIDSIGDVSTSVGDIGNVWVVIMDDNG